MNLPFEKVEKQSVKMGKTRNFHCLFPWQEEDKKTPAQNPESKIMSYWLPHVEKLDIMVSIGC